MSNITVCMASYNGEKFIGEQLISILSQIGSNDEVVVVDDGSTDKTIDVINGIEDSRIKIIELRKNVGHVKAFEEALKHAAHEIIFLSDQDDIWFPGKYQKVLEEIGVVNDTVLVVHSLSSINATGKILSNNWLSLPAASLSGLRFLLFELIKPRVFGSATAFRSGLLEVMLPFPSCVYAHDHWLVICAAMNGKSKFMTKNLTYRRIHSDNLTPKNGVNYGKKLYLRLVFFQMIFLALYRVILRGYRNERK
jgi:glycosyltransferase involved in cell wall biosynthesis